MCGGEEWEKGSIEVGEMFERYITFYPYKRDESAIMGRVHSQVCINCGFVLTFIGKEHLPSKKK
jgi:hypothetical protein